jgi:hypothetical protein
MQAPKADSTWVGSTSWLQFQLSNLASISMYLLYFHIPPHRKDKYED